MLRFFLLALCLTSAVAMADSVNKCRDAAGQIVYQSDPCSKTGAQFVKSVSGSEMNTDGLGGPQEKPLKRGHKTSSSAASDKPEPTPAKASPSVAARNKSKDPYKECPSLRERKKLNEAEQQTQSTEGLVRDHQEIVDRMAAVDCKP